MPKSQNRRFTPQRLLCALRMFYPAKLSLPHAISMPPSTKLRLVQLPSNAPCWNDLIDGPSAEIGIAWIPMELERHRGRDSIAEGQQKIILGQLGSGAAQQPSCFCATLVISAHRTKKHTLVMNWVYGNTVTFRKQRSTYFFFVIKCLFCNNSQQTWKHTNMNTYKIKLHHHPPIPISPHPRTKLNNRSTNFV